MRRHNTTLFRVARSILRNDAAAEEAVQDAYLDAFRHIGAISAAARGWATWLTRITINRALMTAAQAEARAQRHGVRRRRGSARMDPPDGKSESPSIATLRGEIRAILERRIDELPVAFRTVFVLRDVEELSVEETAACLSIPRHRRPSARASSAPARCCAKRSPATSIAPPSTSSASPAPAATASSPRCSRRLGNAGDPRCI